MGKLVVAGFNRVHVLRCDDTTHVLNTLLYGLCRRGCVPSLIFLMSRWRCWSTRIGSQSTGLPGVSHFLFILAMLMSLRANIMFAIFADDFLIGLSVPNIPRLRDALLRSRVGLGGGLPPQPCSPLVGECSCCCLFFFFFFFLLETLVDFVPQSTSL